jgi:dipeptidyl-peptidase 4
MRAFRSDAIERTVGCRSAMAVITFLILASVLATTCLGGCGAQSPVAGPVANPITARQLEEPNALVGPGPTNLSWSPRGAQLAYVQQVDDRQVLQTYDASSGEEKTALDPAEHPDNIDVTSAQWSPQGDAMLFSGDSSLWVLQVDSGDIRQLAKEGGAKTAMMFSPSGERISFVQNNDIYTVNLSDGEVKRLTTDGSDAVYNGNLDWVYTEELATRNAQPAYSWSLDGSWMIYMRLDDSRVQRHPVTDYQPVPPTVSYTRYPTAGTTNPEATLHVINPETGSQSQAVSLPQDTEYILPYFVWTPDSQEATYITVNRDQNALQLNTWNPSRQASRTILKETDPHWINEDLYVAPSFLGDGQRFLWLSERDGFMHVYLYSRNGELIKQLTKGDWLVDTLAYDVIKPEEPVFVIPPKKLLHVDPLSKWAYFTTTKNGPLQRQIYRLNIESGQLVRISKAPGFHSVALSGDGEYIVDQYSSLDEPPVTSISRADGSDTRVLAKCAGPSIALPKVKREFVNVEGSDGVELKAQIVKPENFDPDKKYGVVVHWYGGPGLQLVSNRYGTTNIFNSIERDVLYTQQGFIVWRLDNRGSFGRGHAFETPIDGRLGPVALEDQLAGVQYLKSLPYVDAGRIGTDGKSFGGFLTLYALINKPDVFRCGVAGSGPTNWKYYDTIYTERYMGTPEGNKDGYAATDLISVADKIGRRPLIIHGLADTNVHLQNSVNFIQALEHADKEFDFIPLPNEDHHYEGDGLVSALSASVSYFAQNMGSK